MSMYIPLLKLSHVVGKPKVCETRINILYPQWTMARKRREIIVSISSPGTWESASLRETPLTLSEQSSCFSGGSEAKNLPAKQEMGVQSLAQEDPLEEEMATHSSILAWEISWTEEPGKLQSMGSQKGQAQLSDSTTAAKFMLLFPQPL